MRRLLVANRGEIARRVFRTCRDLGIETVAVYAEPDAGAPHVAEADYAVGLPGTLPYLDADLLVDAARRAGADAVHPGYGFLSENAAFAEAVVAASLTWVGPPAKAIAAMGSKVEAKRLMADAGVPTLDMSPDTFPVLVKASAGGGGRGMRIVRDPADLPGAMAAAEREAAAAFGDGTVFVERYVERARHIEVQVIADRAGTVVALGERECSIQRRHQKIIEECPSPAVSPDLRTRLCDAAVAAARAVDYVGAGTVEFLLAPDGGFFFLEMNTRLQVEHPVTELVYGVDLVALQLSVADGSPLPFAVAPEARGHAIEARLYAEDPRNNWAPSTGPLHRFEIPEGVRVDAGVESGSVVSAYYDPMLAKVIAWAPAREYAARRLADALRRSRLHGVVTNRDLLVRLLRADAFLAGDTDTGFLDRDRCLFDPLLDTDGVTRAAHAAALHGAWLRRQAAPVLADLPVGWRNNPTSRPSVTYDGPHGPVTVEYTGAHPSPVTVTTDGVNRSFEVTVLGDTSYVDGPDGSVTLVERPRFGTTSAEVPAGSLLAPMPGAVGRIEVAVGQPVLAGDLLLTLEAMKLEHAVHAPADGVVVELTVTVGTQVEPGTVLAVIAPGGTP